MQRSITSTPDQASNRRGFTIVELLIVIVVIGILAAITIVAYNGISTRAENTKTIAALKQYSDGISMYQVTNGQYPTVGFACLGASDGICGQVTDGGATCTIGGATSSPAFDSAMTATLGKLPQLSSQRMNCGGKMYAGALYYSPDGKNGIVYYLLRGSQDCPSIGIFGESTRIQQEDDMTLCVMWLPTLP